MSFFDVNDLGEHPGGSQYDQQSVEPPAPGTIEALSCVEGRFYTVQIFAPSLGVKFNKARDLANSVYLAPDPLLIQAAGDLPVVAFVFQNSAARKAGVGVGHILIKIDQEEIFNSKDVAMFLKNRPRPVTCEFFIPRTEILTSEGPALVKYDSKTTKVPEKLKEWKFKYVVIGGIISQPYVMRMYQTRAEYDRAVTETQAGKHVTVKIKTFDLKYARLHDDFGDPKEVRIKEKPEPWRYIVVLPGTGNPIKIAAPSVPKLRPIHDSLRRVIAELDAQDPMEMDGARGSGGYYGNEQFDEEFDGGYGDGGYDSRSEGGSYYEERR